jgi:hypothetical protein
MIQEQNAGTEKPQLPHHDSSLVTRERSSPCEVYWDVRVGRCFVVDGENTPGCELQYYLRRTMQIYMKSQGYLLYLIHKIPISKAMETEMKMTMILKVRSA